MYTVLETDFYLELTYRCVIHTQIFKIVPVHVEDMTLGAMRVHIPDDLVVETHVEDRVVSKHKPVYGVERRCHIHPARRE